MLIDSSFNLGMFNKAVCVYLKRHLASDDLMRLFGVTTLEQFYELPEWKRIELKKKAKLF